MAINIGIRPTDSLGDFQNKSLVSYSRAAPGVTGMNQPAGAAARIGQGLPTSGLDTAQAFQGLRDVSSRASAGHSAVMNAINAQKRRQAVQAGRGNGSSASIQGVGDLSGVQYQADGKNVPGYLSARRNNNVSVGGVSQFSNYGYGGAFGLQKNAAQALLRLNAAYKQRWGQDLSVSTAYRNVDDEMYLRNLYLQGKGAYTPGITSHNRGTSIDFAGPISGRSAQQAWLASAARQFGWSWTGQRYNEPWHFSYGG